MEAPHGTPACRQADLLAVFLTYARIHAFRISTCTTYIKKPPRSWDGAQKLTDEHNRKRYSKNSESHKNSSYTLPRALENLLSCCH